MSERMPSRRRHSVTDSTVLSVDDLTVTVNTRRGPVRAVAGVSWRVRPGETFALVGESGSGKSMTLLAATGLAPRAATVTGRVRLLDTELTALPDDRRRKIRGRHVGFVFQDPTTSLNPVLPVGRQVTEAAEEHLGLTRRAARDRAVELLELVGIPSAARRVDAYPHQFSGGMRQRVAIAMALACEPDLLIADEPTGQLDSETGRSIMDLLRAVVHARGMTALVATHDPALIELADRTLTLRDGRLVPED